MEAKDFFRFQTTNKSNSTNDSDEIGKLSNNQFSVVVKISLYHRKFFSNLKLQQLTAAHNFLLFRFMSFSLSELVSALLDTFSVYIKYCKISIKVFLKWSIKSLIYSTSFEKMPSIATLNISIRLIHLKMAAPHLKSQNCFLSHRNPPFLWFPLVCKLSPCFAPLKKPYCDTTNPYYNFHVAWKTENGLLPGLLPFNLF